MSWLEVAIKVKGELAEPLAELFARYAQGGVAINQALPTPANLASGESDPIVTVRAYIPLDENHEQQKHLLEQGLWHLGQISPLPAASYRKIEHQDWSVNWRQHYHPIPIGTSLLVLPAWMEKPSGERHAIILEPGMAFGTGTHPTTKLCLLAIEKYCSPADVIIDLGCGSGILSIGALRCGADRALAFDIDPDAISSAKRNLELNHIRDEIELVQGSLPEAQRLCPPDGVPLLVANILAPILIELLEQGLSQLVMDQGVIILSGILEDQLPGVLHVTKKKRLKQLEIYTEEDWRALVMMKE